MVGEMPVERSTQLLLLTPTGVNQTNGSTADQGRTGRKDSSSRLRHQMPHTLCFRGVG
jgi:hypothetical protein